MTGALQQFWVGLEGSAEEGSHQVLELLGVDM
jgi:hypothetical protein